MPHKVQLVGAGPGAMDLLTLRALRAIEGAQALLYDALVCDEVIALAPERCLRIQTGKRSGKASMKQDEINALMLRLANKGLKVVRLKGGDPSVFGRVGEERDYLEARGVDVEVIPGITAASAAAAQFSFPLTHRGEARRVMFVTARIHDGRITEDWSDCADPETTVCVYMGRDSARAVSATLIGLGRALSTPAAILEDVGGPDARLVRTDLQFLGDAAEALDTARPMLLVIGDVTRRAAHLTAGSSSPALTLETPAPRARRFAP